MERTAEETVAAHRERDEIGSASACPPASALLQHCFSTHTPEGHDIRRLAYANSICLLFIALAVVGIRTPVFVIKTTTPSQPSVPVVFEAPAPQTPVVQTPVDPEMSKPDSAPAQEAPQVVPALVADSANVAFAIPVEGPVILTPAAFAPPPPRKLAEPPAPAAKPGPSVVAEFHSGTKDGGSYPEPDYPPAALKRKMEGKVILYVEVDPSGSPTLVEIRDSSGYNLLDNHAVNTVKRRWQWPAGTQRQYFVPFRFQITRN